MTAWGTPWAARPDAHPSVCGGEDAAQGDAGTGPSSRGAQQSWGCGVRSRASLFGSRCFEISLRGHADPARPQRLPGHFTTGVRVEMLTASHTPAHVPETETCAESRASRQPEDLGGPEVLSEAKIGARRIVLCPVHPMAGNLATCTVLLEIVPTARNLPNEQKLDPGTIKSGEREASTKKTGRQEKGRCTEAAGCAPRGRQPTRDLGSRM